MRSHVSKGFRTSILLSLLLLLAGWSGWSGFSYAQGAKASRGSFPLDVNGRAIDNSIDFEPVMPGAEVIFTTAKALISRVSVSINDVQVQRTQQGFVWKAPKRPGLKTATITLSPVKGGAQTEILTVQLFVMATANTIKNGYLNGYRIGQYPAPLRDMSAYNAPAGFIQVTAANKSTRISPNFTLGQFLCKQAGGYPKYLILQPALLLKLEGLLLEINKRGIPAESFVVMSGYRTPYYNAAIANVPSSYHIYGGAADVFIDVKPKDGVMDDLNRDGRQTHADAEYLYKLADSYVERNQRPDLAGGVGEYRSNAAHGPFVHVDVRGTPARWGHSD